MPGRELRTFLSVAANALVVFHDEPTAGTAAMLAGGLAPAAVRWSLACVDVTGNPQLVQAFSLAGRLPALLIMREEVALYCERLEPDGLDAAKLLVARAALLDMRAVHEDLAETRRNQTAFHERRVCPTARRGRFPPS